MIIKLYNKIKNNPTFLSVVIVSSFYLFSRVLGFARSVLIYQRLDKLSSDLFITADKLPTTVTNLLLMGTVFSSLLPVLSRYLNSDSEKQVNKGYRFFNIFSFLIIFIIIGFVFLGLVFTEQILLATTSDVLVSSAREVNLWDDYLLTSRILFFIPVNFALQALFGVILNIKKKFFVFSIAGTLANFGGILGLILSQGSFISFAIGIVIGTTLSSIAYILTSLLAGYKIDINYLNPENIKNELADFKQDIVHTFQVFVPRIFLIDGFLISSLFLSRIANDTGQNTAFDIATSIQSSFFVVVYSLGLVLFPELSKSSGDKSKMGQDIFWQKLGKYLMIASVMGIFLSFVTIFGTPLVMWFFKLFGKGQDNAPYIIFLSQISAFRLFFQSLKEILDKYFFALENKWRPIILSISSILVQGFVMLILIQRGGVDAGVIVTFGLVAYIMVWAILACFQLRSDYRDYQESNSLDNK